MFVCFRFIYEAKTKDGEPFTPGSLTSLAAGIQRHLREDLNREPQGEFKILDKNCPQFKTFREALDGRRKQLFSVGIGAHPKRADPILASDEAMLWDRGVLDADTGQGLLNIVYFYNCKAFGFRAVDEHEHLMHDQYNLAIDPQTGKETLTYLGRLSKNQEGTVDCKNKPKIITHVSDPTNPRDIVKLFKKYLSFIPSNGRFYRKALASKG